MTGDSLLLEVSDLHVEYPQGRRLPPLQAVDGVTFNVSAGETVGVVGESGSGKSSIGRAILGLTPVRRGRVVLSDRDITHLSYRARRPLSAKLQVVFQDPYSSFNPSRTVGQSLNEMLRPQGNRDPRVARARAADLLEAVGLPTQAADRYPNSFSGGQRQRLAIARALMTNPQLVICDEAVSALDLSVQAQVLNLLRDLQETLGLAYIFISHDLAVVRHVSKRIVVLYQGRVMEAGDAEAIYQRPAHPYTRLLLDAEPVPDPRSQRQRRLTRPRDVPVSSPGADACPFAPRCPHATEICWSQRPVTDTTPSGAVVACHHWVRLGPQPTTHSAQPAWLTAPSPTPGLSGGGASRTAQTVPGYPPDPTPLARKWPLRNRR